MTGEENNKDDKTKMIENITKEISRLKIMWEESNSFTEELLDGLHFYFTSTSLIEGTESVGT